MSRSNGSAVSHEDRNPTLGGLIRSKKIRFGDILSIPTVQVRRMEDQPRSEFDATEMASLRSTMEDSTQLLPGYVHRLTEEELAELDSDSPIRFEIIDGERRFRSCVELGIPWEAREIIGTTPRMRYEIAVSVNFNRVEHNVIEKMQAIMRLRESYTVEEVSTRVGLSTAAVFQYQRLSQLESDILALMGPPTPKPQRLRKSVALAIVHDLAPELHREAIDRIYQGGNLPTLYRARSVIGTMISTNTSAALPNANSRQLDARDSDMMIERFVERGDGVVNRLTNASVKTISRDRRLELDYRLKLLIADIEMLRHSLAHDLSDELRARYEEDKIANSKRRRKGTAAG